MKSKSRIFKFTERDLTLQATSLGSLEVNRIIKVIKKTFKIAK